MKTFLPLLAAVALTASAASAQITVLSEDFTTWPPTGWTTTAVAGTGWIHDTALGRAWHEDEILQSDSRLTTPALDLSALSSVYLHFDGETNWAQYLANHPSSVGNGVSTMEVSTDGGVTWTVVWTDRLTACDIDRGPRGEEKASDHTPVWCELDDGPDSQPA